MINLSNTLKKKNNKKGFTLIELIVVIAILAILAALAVPRLTGSRDKANRSAVLANLRTIESALSIAEAEGKNISAGIGTASTPNSLVGEGYLKSAPVGPNGVSSYGISSNRATVTFGAEKQFGFKLNTAGTISDGIAASTAYTIDQLAE